MVTSGLSVKCVLAIGDTGNGKSFTATVFGATAEVGHGPSSMTNKVKVHRCVDNRFVYIDTPGFNDSNPDKADQDTARSILITMRDAQPRIEWVHTILWFVDTTDRAKATFQRQAGLIRDLASYHNGNVWDNVIVVIKGLEIDDQCVNAIKTACYPGAQRGTNHDILINLGVFKVWLYDRLPERSVYRRLNPDERANCGIYTNEELLPKYIELMQGHEQHPIKILFQDATCQKCGEVTDPRIASSRCHVKRIMAHQPGFTQVHPKGTMKAHARNSYIVPYHPNPNKESYHPSTELVHRMPHLRKEHDSSAIIVKRHMSNRLVHSRGFIGKHSDTCQKLRRHKDMGMTHTGRQVEDARDLGAGLNLLGFGIPKILTEVVDMIDPRYKWSCCGGSGGSGGCVYMCCDRMGAGCEEYYACGTGSCSGSYGCCDKPKNSEGCVYDCCKGTGPGCDEVYSCCDGKKPCGNTYTCCGGAADSPGCSRSCCQNLGGDGCKERYTCCGNIEMCRKKFSCCGADADGDPEGRINGCRTVYKCCEKDEGKEGCVTRHMCGCDVKNHGNPTVAAMFDESDGCKPVCKACGAEWANEENPGCSTAERHDFGPHVPLPNVWL